MTNKTRLEMGAKVVALFLFGLLTIITCAGVWNYCPETWVKWCAGALFVCNGIGIYFLAKRISDKYETDETAKK